MNTITIQLCAEDRARLDRVIELLGGLQQPNCSACVEGVAKYMDHAASIMDAQPVAVHVPEFRSPEDPVPEAPVAPAITLEQVTLEKIQKKATQIAAGSADKKAKLRAIVNRHAQKVTDIPESAWADVWSALCALEKEA